ncbi:nuclear polyadenylated RNA-binding protein 3 [Saxophila tyrrhenica]|uniref:Nuclear polyadenylated RNA-binding protein 3 n=1 Tax=Saxophila tyrrhenica TaxID=1690608 RepID=A0AAV9PGS6_9PEZI|nr:nuclear polyadenylated RNA-binding protein 3 [Saxophila tyrrhenica]
MSSEPPEEPQYRNEPSILSPASPRPIHFPTPTNIPVLEMQHDIGFNQTEPHMTDPATRNTDVRPNMWRDPNDPEEEQPEHQQHTSEMPDAAVEHVTPYSTGAGDVTAMEMDTQEDGGVAASAEQQAHSTEPASTDAAEALNHSTTQEPEPTQFSTSTNSANDQASVRDGFPPPTHNATEPSSDPSVPTADATSAPITQESVLPSDAQTQPGETAAQAFNPSSVDVQALLDTLQNAPSNAHDAATSAAPPQDGMTAPTTESPSVANQTQQAVPSLSSPVSANALGAPASGLPPRPPPQEQPLINPNYVHSQHIRDYHPHAANPAFHPHTKSSSQGHAADPPGRNYVPPVLSPTSANAGTPAQSIQSATYSATAPTHGNGQAATYPSHAPFAGSPGVNSAYSGAPQYGHTGTLARPEDFTTSRHEFSRHEDRPWDAEVQRKYDQFIEEERAYVSEGRWEQFPNGARLFVGNLSSEKVTKRDIFHVFHPYGELAQISIKQAYGFVQFLRTEDCMKALHAEQGTQIRDKRIHLEVSKPQKNRPQQGTQRRSRSPPDLGRGRPGQSVDRYVSGGRGINRRDDYRPGGQQPFSPRGYNDRYDDRYRARSRSPGFDRGGGGRYRSRSPPSQEQDQLPLPRRAPRDVPDVQIIVIGSLDRDFIAWVESAFNSRSVRAEVLLLSPRLPEEAVIRRQIVEGVAAVVKLVRQNQNTGKIGLQIFDRSKGASNVAFEEYDGLDPQIAVELVLRAKTTKAAPAPQQGYGGGYGAQQQQRYGGYNAPAPAYGDRQGPPPQHPTGLPPGYAPQPPMPQGPQPGVPPNLQNLITNLDQNNLQNLLSAMNTPQSAANAANPYSANAQASAVQALQQNPAVAGYLQQQQQQQQGGQSAGGAGQQVNMQDILARLGSGGGYQR